MCQAWESTARELERTSPETRVVLLRLGIVLDRDGGALGKMLPTFQIFAGGPMGDGAQWFSWIHREDAVGIILESLSNTGLRGPVNVTAPNPVRMGEMCAALGRTLGRPPGCPFRTCHTGAPGEAPPWCCGAEGGAERGASGGIQVQV